ncbi:MAG: hypothetical protein F6K04_17360 [Leptolyngbya sp. SIO4C5]|uniref:hypothetical protein n=1 Tax=Sphaerothrix gracilis TaxID=3151835 RepID=UPI0013C1A06B|nr:hypothetical protein [Leptolyngbya sp. SIO4C5]
MLNPKTEQLQVVEDLLVAVETSQSSSQDIVLVSAKACLDLADYDLNTAELYKLKQILKDLNTQLAESLQREHPAASVVLEICSKS